MKVKLLNLLTGAWESEFFKYCSYLVYVTKYITVNLIVQCDPFFQWWQVVSKYISEFCLPTVDAKPSEAPAYEPHGKYDDYQFIN